MLKVPRFKLDETSYDLYIMYDRFYPITFLVQILTLSHLLPTDSTLA